MINDKYCCVDHCVAMYRMNKETFELSIFNHFEK